MGKIQSISNQLLQINGDVFQELCDAFLVLRNKTYKAFVRSGSSSNKQKAVKGTPDSFMLLSNGNYLFMEATTIEKKSLEDKLRKDILKCFDSKKTGIPKSKIQEIVLCYNADLKASQIEQLNLLITENNEYAASSFYGLDRLSTEIALHHRNLAREYLDLPLDTGQIISLKQFIDSYNRSSHRIATPLDNEFITRDKELKEFKDALVTNDLLILSGPPGVGKTRLAIEVIRKFLEEQIDFDAFALANKDADILEDLDHYVSSTSKTILFVDDVNRYDRFQQVLGFFRYSKNLKLVLTVRDYALPEVQDLLVNFNPSITTLQKFKDEDVKAIIEAKPFEIKNTSYHQKIFEIADGNPRLAIMAALLANKENKLESLSDVSDLFDQYFNTYIQDKKAFNDTNVLKALGIVSFFFTLPYNDEEILKKIEQVFQISKGEFIEAVDELEKLELVQIQYDHIKIGEQNVGTYYFHKVFIKDKILSFQALLRHYFFSMTSRFKDTVIPANNTFGYNRLKQNIEEDLKSFWSMIQGYPEQDSLKFLEHFWFYMHEEAQAYLLQIVQKLVSTQTQPYITDYETNDYSYNQNPYIEILGELMRINKDLQSVLAIAFEFVRKKPEHLPELIKKLDERFSIDIDDERYGLPRHVQLLDFFQDRIGKEDILIDKSFIALSKNLLKFRFQQFKGVRGNAISIYHYPLQFYKPTQEFRERLWNLIDGIFNQYQGECLSILFAHQRERLEFSDVVFRSDLKSLVTIINRHLDINSYKHCFYISELISWCEEIGIQHKEFEVWKQSFTNRNFEWFLISDWNYRKGREIYDCDNWDEFRAKKEVDIRNSLFFDSTDKWEDYLKFIQDAWEWEEANRGQDGYWDTIDIVIDETFLKSKKLGFQFFQSTVDILEANGNSPHRTIKRFASKDEWNKEAWELQIKINVCDWWKIVFHYNLPAESISQYWINELYSTFDQLTESYYFDLSLFKNHLKIDNELYENLLEKVLSKQRNGKLRVTLCDRFIEEVSPHVSNLSLLKEAYLTEQSKGKDANNSQFDYDGSELCVLLKRDSHFIIDYVKQVFENDFSPSKRDYRELRAVWSLDNYLEVLDIVLDIVLEKKPFTIGEHFINVFFEEIGENAERAVSYLLKSIKDNNQDPEKVSILIDVIGNSFSGSYEEALRLYLHHNSKLEDFKQIDWLPDQGMMWGSKNTIFGDIRAARWTKVKSIIDSIGSNIELIPIKNYVSERIRESKESGDSERRREFLSPDW